VNITIEYLFGIFVAAAYIYTAFISRTMGKNRYRMRLILAAATLLFGLIIHLSHIFKVDSAVFIIFGAAPFSYLLHYEVIRRVMRPLIGDYPYAPHWDKIGSPVKGEGYPKNRIVTNHDQVFGVLMLIIPIITLLFFQ
jgi:hypothetical protein